MVLIKRDIESIIIDFLSNEIGRAITFKYQCPYIILKNTPAVINDPMTIEKDAINNKSLLKILGKIFNKE